MTKKQEKIYEFLLQKPSYISTGYSQLKELGSEKDVKIAKAEARKTIRGGNKKQVAPIGNFRNAPGTYLVTGCLHAPWHNKAMYDSVFNYVSKEVDLQGLILAGDFLDMNSLSFHDKGSTPIQGVTLAWEYAESNKLLDQFDDLNIKGTKDFLYGNHEDRYLRLMKKSDEAKYGKALISPEEGLKLKERGYSVYTKWKDDCIKVGEHLDIYHGEICTLHAAKKTIDVYRRSAMFFHTHRFQMYVEGNMGGYNMGCGADLSAPIFGYATRAMKASWVNSCALVTLDENGFYHVQPMTCMENKLFINGKNY